uniref:Putative secreted protein n=1 Tax=Anopheles darlingi TaxID=43151 RepID=A0A2M4D5A5_ANODA
MWSLLLSLLLSFLRTDPACVVLLLLLDGDLKPLLGSVGGGFGRLPWIPLAAAAVACWLPGSLLLNPPKNKCVRSAKVRWRTRAVNDEPFGRLFRILSGGPHPRPDRFLFCVLFVHLFPTAVPKNTGPNGMLYAHHAAHAPGSALPWSLVTFSRHEDAAWDSPFPPGEMSFVLVTPLHYITGQYVSE